MLQLDLIQMDWALYLQYLFIIEISLIGGIALRGKVIKPFSDKQTGTIHLGTMGELIVGVLIAFAFNLAQIPHAITIVTNAGTAGVLGTYYRTTDSKKKDEHISRVYSILTELRELLKMSPAQVQEAHTIQIEENMNLITSLVSILATKPFTNGDKPLIQTLREHHKEYTPDVEKSPLPIMTYNALGEIIAMNEACEEMIGSPKDFVMQTVNMTELENKALRSAIIESLIGNEGNFTGEYQFLSNPERTIQADFNTYPIKTEEEIIIGGYFIVEDYAILKNSRTEDPTLEEILAEIERRATIPKSNSSLPQNQFPQV